MISELWSRDCGLRGGPDDGDSWCCLAAALSSGRGFLQLTGENRTQREVQACKTAAKVGDMKMSDDEFERAIEDALAGIPDRFKQVLENVGIAMAQEPNERELGTMCDAGGELLGLYEGIAITRRTTAYSGVMPDVITIFKGPRAGMRHPCANGRADPQDRAARDRPLLRLRRRLPARAWLLEAATRRRTQGRVSARNRIHPESFGTSHCRRGAIRAGSVPHDSSGSGKAAGRSRAAAPRGPTHQRIFRREALTRIL